MWLWTCERLSAVSVVCPFWATVETRRCNMASMHVQSLLLSPHLPLTSSFAAVIITPASRGHSLTGNMVVMSCVHSRPLCLQWDGFSMNINETQDVTKPRFSDVKSLDSWQLIKCQRSALIGHIISDLWHRAGFALFPVRLHSLPSAPSDPTPTTGCDTN